MSVIRRLGTTMVGAAGVLALLGIVGAVSTRHQRNAWDRWEVVTLPPTGGDE